MQIDKEAYFRKIGYEPHPKQWLFHNSAARFRVPVCGRRFGKSTMAGRDREPQILLPNQRGWIVGPTYDLAEKEFRVIWDDMIVNLGLGRSKKVKKAYNKRTGDMRIEFPWRHYVECRSADHPDNLVGEKLDWAIMSEAAKHRKDTFERFIRPALADKRGGADFPTTPEGFNWLYEAFTYGQSKDHPDYASWRFPSWDNPTVYPDGRQDAEILLVEATSLKEWFLQEYAAEFTAFVGKIYGEWQEDVHVIPDYQFHPEWPNYIAFDWGYVNPLAAIEFQVSPDDTIYVWREHYKSYMRLEEHLMLMKYREQPEGYHINMCFGDAADPEATETVSVKFAPCLSMPDAKSNWRQGVALVKKFLAKRAIDRSSVEYPGEPQEADAMEKPGLFVTRNCKNTIREFNNYRAPNALSSKNPKNPREDAQKYDDHALDALRYGLVHIFQLGATHHLSDFYKPTVEELSPKPTASVPVPVASSELDVSAVDEGWFTTTGLDF